MPAAPDVAGLPWPEGDPGDLKDGAAKARDVATAVRQAGQRLSKAAPSGNDWKGKAASSFVSAVSDDGRDLEKAAGSFSSVAGALSKLATVLDDAQEEVKRWARKVKDAEERAKEAEQRASDAATKLEAAQARTNPILAPLGTFDPLGPFTAPAERAAYQSAQGVATEAKGDLITIRTKAKEEAGKAVKKVERADQDAADTIRDAKGKAPMGDTKGGGASSGSKVPSKPRLDAGSGLFPELPGVGKLGPKAGVLGYGAKAMEGLFRWQAGLVDSLSIDPTTKKYAKTLQAYSEMASRNPKAARALAKELGSLTRLLNTERYWAGRIRGVAKTFGRGALFLGVYDAYSKSSAQTNEAKLTSGVLGAAVTAHPAVLAGDLATGGMPTATADLIGVAGEGLVQALKHGDSSYLLGPGLQSWNDQNLSGKNGWVMKSAAETGEIIKEPVGNALDEIGGREGWPFEGDGSVKWPWE